MANVIDTLLIALGFDTSGLKKGSKDAKTALGQTGDQASKTGKQMEEAAKKGGQAISQLRNEILRTAAAIVGLESIKSFVANVTKTDNALGFMAANVHMTTQAFSAWQGAAKAAGGSAEAMGNDIGGLSQSLSRFQLTGEGGGFVKYLNAMKVAMVDAQGKARPMSEVLLDLADRFHGMDAATAQTLGAGLGLSSDSINFLARGRVEVQKFVDTYARLDARTPEDVANARARIEAWTLLTSTFNRLATNVLNFVTPAMTGFLNLIRDNAGPAVALVGALTVGMTALSLVRFGGVISSLAGLLGGVGGIAGLGVGGTLVAGITVLAAAVFALAGVANLMDPDKKTDGDKHPGEHWVPGKGRSGAGGYWERDDGRTGNGRGQVDPEAVARGLAARGAASSAAPTDKQAYLSSLEKQFGLPAGLLDAVWSQESGRGSNKGPSRAGAQGDFQFMPGTAKQYGVDVSDFKSSASGAAHMYRDLLKQYGGNLAMALAAYNNGSGNLAAGVMRPETSNYVRQIMGRMGMSQSVANNSNSSEVHIGQVNVQVPSGDPTSIAHHLPRAIKNQTFALQANAGLSS